jgi:hypothetical protein
MGKTDSKKFKYNVYGSEFTISSTSLLKFFIKLIKFVFLNREMKMKCDLFEDIGMNLVIFVEVLFI